MRTPSNIKSFNQNGAYKFQLQNEYDKAVAQFLGASKSADFDSMDLLLEKNPGRINHRNERSDTALMIAARDGRTGTIIALLSRGANPLLINKDEQTALMIAEGKKHKEIAFYLKDAEETWKKSQQNQLTPTAA